MGRRKTRSTDRRRTFGTPNGAAHLRDIRTGWCSIWQNREQSLGLITCPGRETMSRAELRATGFMWGTIWWGSQGNEDQCLVLYTTTPGAVACDALFQRKVPVWKLKAERRRRYSYRVSASLISAEILLS